MTPTPRIAHNIDEVLVCLEKIIADAISDQNRCGYFAALYYKVTLKVKEGVEDGQFEDGERLAELDVLFANRYLYAYQEWRNSKPVSQSWQIAFDATGHSKYLVLQHLLLGMNAHINYDLGIAVNEAVQQGQNINELRKDYNAINTILSALTYGVIHNLNMLSPLLSFLGFSGNRSTSMLVQFSLSNARDGSWCFATDLAEKSAGDFDDFIAKRDVEIADLGGTIIHNRGLLNLGVGLIHVFEWKNVRKIMHLLHDFKKPKFGSLRKRDA